MAYTQQEIDFLKKLKSQGLTAEESFAKLTAVKQQLPSTDVAPISSTLPTQAQPLRGKPGFLDYLNPLGPYGLGQQIGKSAYQVGEAVVDIPKTIVKGGLTAGPGGLISSGKALGAQLAGKTSAEIEAARKEPIDIYGFGNINPATDPFKTAMLAGETAAAATLMGKGATVLGTAAKTATLAGTREAQREGATPLDIGVSTLTGGVLGAVAQKGINVLKNALSGKAVFKEAAKTGIKPATIEAIRTAPKEVKARMGQFIQQSEKAAIRPFEEDTAMEILGKDVKSGIDKLLAIQKEAGVKTGVAKAAAVVGKEATPVGVSHLRKTLLTDLAEKGVYVNQKGNLAWGKSTIEKTSADAKMIDKIWDIIKKKDALPMNEAIIVRERIGNLLWQAKGEITAGKVFAKNVIRGITEEVHKLKPGLAKTDKIFSTLKELVDEPAKITKDGAAVLLGRSLGKGLPKYKNMVGMLEDVGKQYNIPEFANLKKLVYMAQSADDAVGIDILAKPTSFAGRAFQAGKGLVKAGTGQPSGAAEVAGALKVAPKQVEVLTKLAKQAGITQKVIQTVQKATITLPQPVVKAIEPLVRLATLGGFLKK